ncbi:MAG: hypothetical protein NVSMB57_02690 [Actinomycetota bacterium]
MKRFVIAAAVTLCFASGSAHASEPSGACTRGFIAPSSGSLGMGVRTSTDRGIAAVIVCNDGSAIPNPGSVKASVNTKNESVTVVESGDSSNALLPCSKGYVGVMARSDGAKLYESGNGTFSAHSHPKAPDAFASSLANDCVKK